MNTFLRGVFAVVVVVATEVPTGSVGEDDCLRGLHVFFDG